MNLYYILLLVSPFSFHVLPLLHFLFFLSFFLFSFLSFFLSFFYIYIYTCFCPVSSSHFLEQDRRKTMDSSFPKLHMLFVAVILICSLAKGDETPSLPDFSSGHYHDQIRRMQEFKSSLIRRELASSPSPSSSPPESGSSPRIYKVTTYGADPTGKSDSTQALLKAIAAVFDDQNPDKGFVLMTGISNLGGAHISLEGGIYQISKPLQLPAAGAGNLIISGGTLRASDDFPADGYLIDLSSNTSSSYNYEYITLRDLMLDCNFHGGGISVINSLRTSIDNCYIAHFTTNGIYVQRGHETYIRNSFLGQHITAGADPGERNFSGTAINLVGNDNAITDVVIFSAAIGVMISGQGNTLSGVHCYNKATGFGGTGIYIRLPNLTQTRIVNCYLDYNGIIAEDPVQLSITNSFFLGDGFVVLKSINGVARGITIADNMFAGSNKGIDIVQLDESNGSFREIEQVFVERNVVKGMNGRSTVASDSAEGNGTIWTVDFSRSLLFPDLINHVQYSLLNFDFNLFPKYALRNVSDNRVVIQSDVPVSGRVFVSVSQGLTG
ncbi:polygalacturonase QRT3 [Euphorbia lathyris]|uniref:polygalacturonase QRT3 n=1 Tax=Euphorbia lathyris TaxID=212925 RepID=UPI0033133701